MEYSGTKVFINPCHLYQYAVACTQLAVGNQLIYMILKRFEYVVLILF